MKDGLSEVAWSKLVERQTAERDARVLQAFNLAQVSVRGGRFKFIVSRNNGWGGLTFN